MTQKVVHWGKMIKFDYSSTSLVRPPLSGSHPCPDGRRSRHGRIGEVGLYYELFNLILLNKVDQILHKILYQHTKC